MTVVTEIRHLQLLLAINEEGTLHAAARRLHLSPSALSQQLRDLEQRLGGALFQRQWRRLVTTQAARHLIEGARGLLTELERLEDETQALMGGADATLRIAMICQETYRWLPDVLLRLATQEPIVDVSIVTDVAHDPTEALAERKIDVALVAGKRTPDRRTKNALIFRDELVAVVSSKHPWAGAKTIPVRAFAQEQLYCDDGAITKRAPLGRLLAEADVSPRKVSIVPTSGTVALDLARANLGVTVMPRFTVAQFARRDGIALVRVGPRGLWLEWAALTRNEPASVGLATFLEIMKACVSKSAAPRKAQARSSPRVPDG